MKTTKKNKEVLRNTTIVVVLLMAIASPVSAANSSESSFDPGMILSILAVVVLAAFMFISMFRAKGKETRSNRSRQQAHQYRKQSQLEHYERYIGKWGDA